MKKGILAVTCIALSGVMLAAFAGCGTVSKAKNMRGDQVSESEWDSAMAGTAYENDTASLPVQTVAEESSEAANYKVEFEAKSSMSYSSEGLNINGTQLAEGSSAKVEANVSAQVTVADNALYISAKYDIKMEGEGSVLEKLGASSKMTGSGEIEIYLSFGDAVAYYYKDDAGNWVSASSDGGIAPAANVAYSMAVSMIDCSAYAGSFAKFEYSEEDKGYVALEASGSLGSGLGSAMASAKLVYKIKDGKLGAIYGIGEGSSDSALFKTEGSSETAVLYTYGGQSITLPTVS